MKKVGGGGGEINKFLIWEKKKKKKNKNKKNKHYKF